MEKFKEVIKRIKELINSFTKPIEQEKSFDELAVAAGIGEADLKILKSSMGGVNWKFADDLEEQKKPRGSSKQQQIQPETRTISIERRKGFERED